MAEMKNTMSREEMKQQRFYHNSLLGLFLIPFSRWHNSCRAFGTKKLSIRHNNSPNRNKHPKHIEEDQIKPQVQPIAAVEVMVAREPLGNKRHEAAIEFTRGQNDDPEPRLLCTAPEALADTQSHRPTDKHGEQLEADNGQVGAGPAVIGLGIFEPKVCEEIVACHRAMNRSWVTEETVCADAWDGGEEAVVEVGTLEDQVCERIEQVPGEERLDGETGFGGEENVGESESGNQEDDGCEERENRCRVDYWGCCYW